MAKGKFIVFKDTFRLLHTVFPYIQCPTSWKKLIPMIEGCTRDTKVNLVRQIKPQNQWIKLNADGSTLTNPGKIGVGGILRSSNSEMIMAYSVSLSEGTNNQAEVEAAIFGLSWCVQLNLEYVILEVDSELLIDQMQEKISPPWNLLNHIKKLNNIINQVEHFICIHTLREGNFVAEAFSKHGHKITNPHAYFKIQELPKYAAEYFHLDKIEMASFRRRKTNAELDKKIMVTL